MSATAFQRARREAATRVANEAPEGAATVQAETERQVNKASSDPKPLGRLSKPELIDLATRLGLGTEGTVEVLRERIRAAQETASKDGGADGDQSV